MVQKTITRISPLQWQEIAEDKKEIIRKWAVKQGFGLDIIPSESAETCDYAALLSVDQMKLLIEDLRKADTSALSADTDDISFLWSELKKLL